MSDASGGGGYGGIAKPRVVNKSPHVQRRDSRPVYGPPVPKPRPVLAHVFDAPPKPRPMPAAPKPRGVFGPVGRVAPRLTGPPKPAAPLYTGRAARVQSHQRAMAATREFHQHAAVMRAQQVHAAARRDVLAALGAAPPRIANSNDWLHPQTMHIGRPLLGPPQPPVLNGRPLSPVQIQASMRRVLEAGNSINKMHDVAVLHAAGVVNPYGTTTHTEAKAAEAVLRHTLIRTLVKRQQAWQNANPQGLSAGPREIAARLRQAPTQELTRLLSWRPSQADMLKAGIQTAGFSPSGVAQTAAMIGNTISSGAGDIGAALGSRFLGNAAGDVASWETQAIPALYSAATQPGQFAKGLAQGVIGHAVRGDWAGAGRVFHNHPIFSLAELRGAASLAGRPLAGAIRQGSRGRILGTARAPINLTGLDASRAYLDRSYSKDPVTMAGQFAADRLMTRPGLDVRVAGKGRVPARVLKTELPVVGGLLEARRVHGINRMTDYNRAQGVSAQTVGRASAQSAANAARYDTAAGRRVASMLGFHGRPVDAGAAHGVLGKIAARYAPKLATDPVANLVSFVRRGVIRSEVVHPDGTRTAATAESVAQDIDHLIEHFQQNLATPGKFKTQVEHEQGTALVGFLHDLRNSGRGLAGAVNIARRLAPEFAKNDAELIRLKALDPQAAERAPLFPFALTKSGARYEDGSLKVNGEPVSNAEIQAQMRALGVDPSTVGHLPHNPLGRGAYFKQDSVGGRRNADIHALTGSLWERANSAHDWQHVVDSLAHGRTLAANIGTLDRFVHDVGVHVGDGSWKDTLRIAENDVQRTRAGKIKLDANNRPIPKWVAVRRVGARLEPDRREGIIGMQDVAHDEPLTQTLLDERLRPPEKDGPNVAVLMPAEAVKRAQEHAQRGSSIAEMQALTSAFRQTVLPFSTKWLTGNIAEAILRTAMVTANPLDPIVARRALDRMAAQDAIDAYGPSIAGKAHALMDTNRFLHPRQIAALRRDVLDHAPNARAAQAELTGGLFYGHSGQTVRRTADQMGPVGKSVAAIGKLPVIHEFAGMTRFLGGKMFTINRLLERESQYTALGKHVRNEVQELTGRWQSGVRLYGNALDDFSKGLLGTAAQVKAARWLDETLGQYSRFDPKTRQFIQTFAPFLPWYINAARFTLLTLPGKHPVKFALWTSAIRTFQQDYAQQHKDARTQQGVQGDLATAIPHNGGYIPAARFTPFGFLGPVMGGDVSAVASPLIPQFSGAMQAWNGNDPFGRQMQIPGAGGKLRKTTGGENFLIGLNQLLEGVVPGAQIARRLEEGGSTAYPDSWLGGPHTKPNSSHGQSAITRIFNPFRPVYLRNSTVSSTSGPAGNSVEARVARALAKSMSSGAGDLNARVARALAASVGH